MPGICQRRSWAGEYPKAGHRNSLSYSPQKFKAMGKIKKNIPGDVKGEPASVTVVGIDIQREFPASCNEVKPEIQVACRLRFTIVNKSLHRPSSAATKPVLRSTFTRARIQVSTIFVLILSVGY